MLMDLDISMRSASCLYTVHFYGALFLEGDVWICMEVMLTSLDKFYPKVYERGMVFPEEFIGKVAFCVSKNICCFFMVGFYTFTSYLSPYSKMRGLSLTYYQLFLIVFLILFFVYSQIFKFYNRLYELYITYTLSCRLYIGTSNPPIYSSIEVGRLKCVTLESRGIWLTRLQRQCKPVANLTWR